MKNKKLFAILTLVCFMMTLMPVAAFADTTAVGPAPTDVDYQESAVLTDDTDASEDVNDPVTIKFDFVDKDGYSVSGTTATVYVWFVKDGSNVATTSVKAADAAINGTMKNGVFEIANPNVTKDYDFIFSNTGNYTVKAAFDNPNRLYGNGKTLAESFSDVEYKLGKVNNQSKIEITSSSSSSKYGTTLTGDTNVVITDNGDQSLGQSWADEKAETGKAKYVADGGKYEIKDITANNVAEKEYTVKLVDKDGKAVKGETITLETNSANIELNKEKATTDQLGQIKFKISGVKDGDYKIYIKAGSYEATVTVTVGATGAYDITCVKSPENPVDVNTQFDEDHNKVQFTFTDANGNAVTTDIAKNNGATKAFKDGKDPKNAYVSIVSQPSASKLENKDLWLVDSDNDYKANLYIDETDLAEGSYEVKVVLDNGKYTTVKFEVKEFQTPVALNLKYNADAVELDSYVEIDTLEWVDANGVTKDCTNKVDLAASGYAVEYFATEKGTVKVNDTNYNVKAGTVFTKDDDKYVGQKITVIAVDDRYNLTAKAELTVADEATELAFDTKTLAVDANNKVGVSVVDSQGNKVALKRVGNTAKSATVSYVVLDKPEGSKVSVNTDNSDNKLLEEGTFKMNVVANKVGNVTIQAVAKVTYTDNKNQNNVVKYYTGTQIFAVGKDSVGQVVVMSIGSNEIIINDAKGTIDAAPMIQNDRTYVPFRALAEAFGATVAYDEATQAVTAELNGVTVVMTIGSATYTVNGAEKTMDVAPFITGSRTMIPVRFAAEAFGIKVIPTYNPDGSTADILFNL